MSNTRRAIIGVLASRGPVSRAELARETRLSKPTVLATVSELISEGVVREVGAGSSARGRRPALLGLGGDSRFVAGVEVAMTYARFLLVDLGGEVARSVELPVPQRLSPGEAADLVVRGIRQLLAGCRPDALIGCGVATPGMVDVDSDTVYSTGFGWSLVPLHSMLESRLGVPVTVADNAHTAGLGELWHRGRDTRKDLVYLYLGWGVGAAIVLGGDLHQGRNHTAGELGGMVIASGPDGRPLTLGELVGVGTLAEWIRRELSGGQDSPLSALPEDCDEYEAARAIWSAAQDGDHLAMEVVAHTARHLGAAVANLVNLLNPEEVVLGAALSCWGEEFAREVYERAAPLSLAVPLGSVRVVPSRAPETASALGAAALVLKDVPELLASPRR